MTGELSLQQFSTNGRPTTKGGLRLISREGEGNLSYLCRGWKNFYAHVVPQVVRANEASAALLLPQSLVRHADR